MPKKLSTYDRKMFVQAVTLRDHDIVREALQEGISPDTASDTSTALAEAAKTNDTRMMQILLEAGANPNLRIPKRAFDGDYGTALNVATEFGKADAMTWLLAHGANPRMLDNSGRTAAHILLQSFARLGPRDAPPDLVEASLRSMLDLGVPVNQRTGPGTGLTLLHDAASRFGVPDAAVTLLLERGADPDAFSSDGMRPLHLACQQLRLSRFRLLVESGVNINLADAHGRTPLHHATGEPMIDLVHEFHPDLEVQDNDGRTALALHLQGHTKPDQVPYSVYRMLEAGASLDTADFEGITPRDIIKEKRLTAIRNLVGAKQARDAIKGTLGSFARSPAKPT